MPYCTRLDLDTAFGESEILQLTDRIGAGVVDEVVLDAAIAAADAEINRRLRAKGWPVPIASSSTDLMRLSLDITRFYLHARVIPPEQVKAAFDRAIKTLNDFVKGLVDLDLGSLPTATVSGAGDVAFTKTADDRMFTKEKLSDY